jgi:hypothetical protein
VTLDSKRALVGATAATADAAASAIRSQGHALLPNVLAASEVADLTRALDRVITDLAIPFGANEFLGFRTRRVFNLLARDVRFEPLPVHPALLPVIERALDRECLLSSLTAIEMSPGESRQPLHADDGTLLRQEEAQLLALPRERVARMAPRLRRWSDTPRIAVCSGTSTSAVLRSW